MTKFKSKEVVIHTGTLDLYVILKLPKDYYRLEHSNERYYVYIHVDAFIKVGVNWNDYIRWSRSEAQMEDGRFISIAEHILDIF